MASQEPKHIVLVGACYLDTILRGVSPDITVIWPPGSQAIDANEPPTCSVPFYPTADSKLRATQRQIRRGGNCPNTLEVLHQLLRQDDGDVILHLVASLPGRNSPATAQIIQSFGETTALIPQASGPGSTTVAERDSPPRPGRPARISLENSFFREGFSEAASSYIIRSEADDSRTIVNYNDLPEMTAAELEPVVHEFRERNEQTWWHFEVRLSPKIHDRGLSPGSPSPGLMVH
jgi:ketohexokinase